MRSRTLALSLLGLSFLTRVAVLVSTRSLALRDDSADYARIGRLLAHGEGFGETVLAPGGGPTAFRPPLYPIFLGAVFRMTGDSITAARLVQAGLGTVTAGLIGVVAWQLFGRRAAVIALGLAAIYPPLILIGNAVLTEPISLPLQMAALATALELRRRPDRPWGYAALPGLLIGLCILTRPANMALVVPIVALLASSAPRGRKLWFVGAALGVMLLTLLPWQIRNQAAFDRFVAITTADGFVAAGVYNDQAAQDDGDHRGVWRVPSAVPELAPLLQDPTLDEAALSDALRERGIDYATEHPGYTAVVLRQSLTNLFDLDVRSSPGRADVSLGYGLGWSRLWLFGYWAVAALAVVGAFTQAARRVPVAVWLAPILYVAITIPTLGTPRYRAPIEPFVVLLAVAALDAWIDRRQRSR